ncbi:MAG: class I SAM-dependent methyltransferase [Candidatus Pacebacteria bacterium]|nr:class I SAM-dependent methyltransferase [Candidatus Paceibacterota bacterium]
MKHFTNYIERNKSVITGKENLEHLYTFKDFPIFFGCVNNPQEQDLLADMEWAIDSETGVIQLTKLIPLEILYREQHVDAFGKIWEQYYNDFAKYIISRKQPKILEIGGGNGKLALTVTKTAPSVFWTIVEPNPLFQGNNRIKVINNFFDKNFKSDNNFDAVIFSQVMEHAYDPREFLENISGFLKPEGHLIFAYPNLKLWLKNKFTNALNFEHTMFLTDYFVDYLLAKNGFVILNKTTYKDHSFFYDVKFIGEKQPFTLENKYSEYKKLFMNFISYHKNMVEKINKKINESDAPIYLFGAHIFSTFLIVFGLQSAEISAILDNSKLKQGRRLYGTSFIVDSPEILRGKGAVNVILKAGIYDGEIKKDILENINPDVTFW